MSLIDKVKPFLKSILHFLGNLFRRKRIWGKHQCKLLKSKRERLFYSFPQSKSHTCTYWYHSNHLLTDNIKQHTSNKTLCSPNTYTYSHFLTLNIILRTCLNIYFTHPLYIYSWNRVTFLITEYQNDTTGKISRILITHQPVVMYDPTNLWSSTRPTPRMIPHNSKLWPLTRQLPRAIPT